MSDICPVDYDHNDDLDECMVCGWTLEAERKPTTRPEDMLSGAYAPNQRVTFICKEDTT